MSVDSESSSTSESHGVTGQGVVRVRAGDHDERGCIVGGSGLAPVGRASQGREFGDLAGELGDLDELAQHQPLLLAVLDMVLADMGRQEVVEPKQDRESYNWCRCMLTGSQRGEQKPARAPK